MNAVEAAQADSTVMTVRPWDYRPELADMAAVGPVLDLGHRWAA